MMTTFKDTVDILQSDTTVNVDNTMSAAEIVAAIQSQPKYIPYGKTLTIQFADGEYPLSATMDLGGFIGAGKIVLQGNTTETAGLHTDQAVHLDFSGVEDPAVAIEFRRISCELQFNYLKVTYDRDEGYGLRFDSCRSAYVQYGYIIGGYVSGDAKVFYGIVSTYGACVYTRNNYLQSAYCGIFSQGGHIFSYDNDEAGASPPSPHYEVISSSGTVCYEGTYGGTHAKNLGGNIRISTGQET